MKNLLIQINFVLFAIVILLVGCSNPNEASTKASTISKTDTIYNTKSGSKAGTSKVQSKTNECSKNSECKSVASSCCGCNAGGTNKAISSKQHAQKLANRQQQCGSTLCPSVMSQHESCTAVAVCIKGQCQLQSGNYK